MGPRIATAGAAPVPKAAGNRRPTIVSPWDSKVTRPPSAATVVPRRAEREPRAVEVEAATRIPPSRFCLNVAVARSVSFARAAAQSIRPATKGGSARTSAQRNLGAPDRQEMNRPQRTYPVGMEPLIVVSQRGMLCEAFAGVVT
jgi:hypothetical protein